jgi:hypothetical protein
MRLRQRMKIGLECAYHRFMITNEIRRRLVSLQNQINALSTLLPENAQIDFRTVDYTQTSDIAERKRLVITVVEVESGLAAEWIERARGKRQK